MAIALVQSAEKVVTGVNNTTLAYTSNVTAGNCLVGIHSQWVGGTNTITTPTDTLTHTYTGVAAEIKAAANNALRGFYVLNCSGGANTVTFDISGTTTGDITVNVIEFSGVATSAALLASGNAGPTTSTTVSTGSVTPSEDNCLVLSYGNHTGNDTTWTENQTLLQEHEGGTSDMPLASQYVIQTTAVAVTSSWTLGASRTWVCQYGVFKAAAGGGGPATPAFRLALLGVGR